MKNIVTFMDLSETILYVGASKKYKKIGSVFSERGKG